MKFTIRFGIKKAVTIPTQDTKNPVVAPISKNGIANVLVWQKYIEMERSILLTEDLFTPPKISKLACFLKRYKKDEEIMQDTVIKAPAMQYPISADIAVLITEAHISGCGFCRANGVKAIDRKLSIVTPPMIITALDTMPLVNTTVVVEPVDTIEKVTRSDVANSKVQSLPMQDSKLMRSDQLVDSPLARKMSLMVKIDDSACSINDINFVDPEDDCLDHIKELEMRTILHSTFLHSHHDSKI